MMSNDYYRGKTAVITGGASGVGRSLAFGLGRAGANVVVGDVDSSAMDAMTQEEVSLKGQDAQRRSWVMWSRGEMGRLRAKRPTGVQ